MMGACFWSWAQKTDGIPRHLDECNTTPVHVPAGTTGLVQPVDVVFNAPFKTAVDRLATAHVQVGESSSQSGLDRCGKKFLP